MKFIKNCFLVFSFFMFPAFFVYADNSPIFETISTTSITENSASLRGDFYFENNNENFPLIWFQYGKDSKNLNNKTEDIIETKKDFIYTKKISDLEPNTKYFFRTVLELNDNVFYGKILSFITLAGEENNKIDGVNYGDGSANEFLNKMISEYDSSLEKSYNGGIDDGEYDSSDNSYKPFTFFDFLNWFKRKDAKVQGNVVHTEDEIRQMEEEEKKRLEMLKTQERYNNSAYENDELGEVVEFNKRNSFSKSKNPVSLIIIFIILLFISIYMAIKMFYLKSRRMINHKKNLFNIKKDVDKTYHSKYDIPVSSHRDENIFDEKDK